MVIVSSIGKLGHINMNSFIIHTWLGTRDTSFRV